MVKKALWFLFFLMMSVSSCLEDPDCFLLNNNVVQISFRKLWDGTTDTVTFIGIFAENAVKDSVFYSNSTISNGTVTLPLNYLENQTIYTFRQPQDTSQLTLYYASKAQFVSEDCGERFVLTDLTVGSHGFDSVRVVNSNLSNNPSAPNIIIYRCPDTDILRIGFKTPAGEDASVLINGITTDYDPLVHYSGVTVSSVDLPLNPEADTTNFSFQFQDSIRNVKVWYARNQQVLYQVCDRTVFSSLQLSSDFTVTPEILSDSIEVPIKTAIKIVTN